MISPRGGSGLADGDLDRLSRIVVGKTGITFSESDEKRRERMRRVVADLAREKGDGEIPTLRRLLLEASQDEIVDDLAPHVTIGETYFFREPRGLEAFRDQLIAGLPREKREGLRIWCAGCSSGEEPYTLSMLLREKSLDDSLGEISLFGTDINGRALERARRAIYSRWSLRGLDEKRVERFFEPLDGDLYSVRPRYRRGVSFSPFNLVAPGPFPWGEGTVDAIFCRNVLIYFDGATRERVLDLFHRGLSPRGWLIVAPCEVSALLGSRFFPLHLDGVTLYGKEEVAPPRPCPVAPLWGDMLEVASETLSVSEEPAPLLEELVFWEGPVDLGTAPVAEAPIGDGLETARRLADEGRLDEALALCLNGDDRTDPRRHYLLAMIHQERGDVESAQASLRRVLYLDPSFVAGHYALGSLALRRGRPDEARRHFRNAVDLLAKMAPDSLVLEGEGMTAAEFRSMMEALRI